MVVSMSAHTPGPWAADKLQDRSAFNIFMPGYCSAGASVHHCSNATGSMSSFEVDANARLIAAAPELLAALAEASVALRTGHNAHVALDRAIATIAKATGVSA